MLSKTLAHASTPTREARFLFVVSFTIFLVIAAVTRLLPRNRRPWPFGPGTDRSLFKEARAIANTVIPFAYMA